MTAAALLEGLVMWGVMLSVLGFFGALFIARRAVPGRFRPAMALWLTGPFLVILIIVMREGDPALSGEAAQGNAVFAALLYGVLLGIPWLTGNWLGARAGGGGR